jgi:hypothetical protein
MNSLLSIDADEVLLADVRLSGRGLIVWLITEAKALLAVLLQIPVGIFKPGETSALLAPQKEVDRAMSDRLVVVKVNLRERLCGHILQDH